MKKMKRKHLIKFLSDKDVYIAEAEHKGGEVNTVFMGGIPLTSRQSNSFELIIRGRDRRKK